MRLKLNFSTAKDSKKIKIKNLDFARSEVNGLNVKKGSWSSLVSRFSYVSNSFENNPTI